MTAHSWNQSGHMIKLSFHLEEILANISCLLYQLLLLQKTLGNKQPENIRDQPFAYYLVSGFCGGWLVWAGRLCSAWSPAPLSKGGSENPVCSWRRQRRTSTSSLRTGSSVLCHARPPNTALAKASLVTPKVEGERCTPHMGRGGKGVLILSSVVIQSTILDLLIFPFPPKKICGFFFFPSYFPSFFSFLINKFWYYLSLKTRTWTHPCNI